VCGLTNKTTESDNHRTTDFLGIGGFDRRPPEWMKAQLRRISATELTVELPRARALMKLGDKTLPFLSNQNYIY